MTRPNGTDRPHVALAITALHGVAGGAERVLVDVANGLYRRGFPVTVLTYQPKSGPSFYPLDFGIRHIDGRRRDSAGSGSSLHAIAGAARRNRLIGMMKWLVQYGPKTLRFRQLLKLAQPDLVIGFLPSSFPYLTLAAAGTSVRSVASIHNVPYRDLGGDPDRWDPNPVDIAVRRRMLERSDATTVLLPSFKKQLDDVVQAKTAVIPNMIDPPSGVMADVSTDRAENTILAVGRLSPAKDHATLVAAWAMIAAQHPSWRLRIIGDGLLRDELERLIETLAVERVSLDQPTDQIETAYRAAKFVVMSSIHEGFGLVTAEAMSFGLPVIGFADCEGTNEIIDDQRNGLLVDPQEGRAESLAAAMAQLIEDEPLRRRLADGAPATVAPFHPEVVIDQWEQLILEVVRGDPIT